MASLEQKRTRAIKGLESCIESEKNVFCPENCPYSDMFDQRTCQQHLYEDLLELIKPRVMTLEDLTNWDGALWIETEDGGKWAMITGTNEYVAFMNHDALRFTPYRFETYGKEWRCWTSRPLEGQEVPWT